MPFITFVTRTLHRRRAMLDRNIASLAEQTDQDYFHFIIVDGDERGVAWANGAMATRDWSDITSDYVMVLDDDDVLNGPDVIKRLKEALELMPVDLLIVRMDQGPRGILPSPGEPIKRGRIGCSAVIPSRLLFLEAVKSYTPKYDGDYDYISACVENAKVYTRLNLIASKVTQVGAYSEV